jgi:predicted DNA binding CopG/RHH family protein
MPTLPTFSTDEELAAWIDANDTAPYLDEMEDVEEPFVMHRTQFASRPLNIRLHADLYAALEAAARRHGVPYQVLVQTWLREKLLQETPDLMIESR